jgi:Ca-activated chloride channel family protein
MELFANFKAFVYLVLAAAAVILFWHLGARGKRAALSALFSVNNYKALIHAELNRRRRCADILFLSGLFFLFIALAAPQWGKARVETQAMYSQAVIAVDISNSMLAQDVKPNRLQSAKTMLSMLIDNMNAERVGLIAFTSQAYLQCPITTDAGALKNLAAALSTENAYVQGTAIGPALTLAVKMLEPYPGKKALVLITDGEDHQPQDIQAAVDLARENEIKIIAIGIGSAEGELIPAMTPEGGKTYKKDSSGKTVLTKLDEKALIAFASATGGVYIKYTTPQQTSDEITAQLAALDKSTAQGSHRTVYKNRFQIPLAIGLLLLLCSVLIPLRKVK